jgi:hypothetical protein
VRLSITAHTTSALLVASAITACGGSTKGSQGTSRTAVLEIVSGNTQSGIAGEELAAAVVVGVHDSSGLPVDGQIINIRVTTGGGTVFAGTALSDANGMARERWTLGPVAGPQRLEARAVDPDTGAAIIFASFDATAVAGAASIATAAAGDNQVQQPGTTLAIPLRVKVADGHGNGVAGVNVIFVLTVGTGSVSAPSTVTDSQGNATTVWTLGPEAGIQKLEARVLGLAPAVFGAGPSGSGAGY